MLGRLSLIKYDLEPLTADPIPSQNWSPFLWKSSCFWKLDNSNFSLLWPPCSSSHNEQISICFWEKKREFGKLCVGHEEIKWRINVLNFTLMKSEYNLKRCSAKKLRNTFESRLRTTSWWQISWAPYYLLEIVVRSLRRIIRFGSRG